MMFKNLNDIVFGLKKAFRSAQQLLQADLPKNGHLQMFIFD